MKLLDLTFPTPAGNLACDEALLDCRNEDNDFEVLRFWEPQRHFVVVGYSNSVEREVNVAVCRKLGIPILRRCSGGGAVLQGPGCLNYSLILQIDSAPALASVTGTNRYVMERNREALEKLALSGGRHKGTSISKFENKNSKREICVCGHTDLAIGGLKFSGNSHRRRKRTLLFHGTFLLNFEIALLEQCLPAPSRQPDYRQNRAHKDFLTNIGIPAEVIKEALKKTWSAGDQLNQAPSREIERLAKERYSADAWNLKF